ncbi:uncharacterized protein UV8b_06548 [Ustilaginoidea virens]|uniref:Conserved oligomeric Golgi complex subunit 1 n=1 Tax=Ustilaginoidea virens TaxID=1159556 RepID=A0A063C8T6_USTVR|nr:uncharacterized protein UV8b_06548 [Ustilaginoidea virens]QUC22307.1 hypothetical protein UV8b_06548 [Ustilaginoidea virens]GAO14145.1 hypothetical protein UVI_02037700 [Ustilaginoidea virens]
MSSPKAPDPATFACSADIFSGNHTLPQIKSIHKSLHGQIEEKAARLRTRVGSSYRQLLGTADVIVQMRGDNERVQDVLGRMGGRCGRSVISSKITGLSNFSAGERDARTNRTARWKLLELCGLVAGRILKGRGGVGREHEKQADTLVLATKVFVISRLLVKSLKEDASAGNGRQAVEAASSTLESLRRRIQRSVERLLENTDQRSGTGSVTKALCAHSLANSSGAKHAIAHFIRVRTRAMEVVLKMDSDESQAPTVAGTTTDDVVRSLRLYTKTLLDVQALIPAKLPQALAQLKSQRLLADASLQQLEGLRLDLYGRSCGEEIQDFTPFIPHDDLSAKQAREMLASFAENGGRVVMSGLKKTLRHMADLEPIIDLRRQVLQLWIRDGGRAKGLDPQEMQDELRETINARLLCVADAKAAKLRLVGSEVKATLEGWREGVSDKHKSLWDDQGYDSALSDGAASFVGEVISRLHGRNDAVSRAAHSYRCWFHVVDDVKAAVERVRKQRWDKDDDEEIEDEETIEQRQKALSQEDPSRLQGRFNESLDQSFRDVEAQLQKLWTQHSGGCASSGAKAIYLVRVVREIRAQLPDRAGLRDFGLALVPALHSRLATTASQSAAEEFISSGLSDRGVAMKPLWEGDPAVPSQPSPALFHFLRDLSLSMTDLGVDLWTPAAIRELKQQLSRRLVDAWRRELEHVGCATAARDGDPDEKDKEKEKERGQGEVQEGGGEAEPDDAAAPASTAQEVCTQWLFDISLLRCCIGNAPGPASSSFDELEREAWQRSGLDEAPRQRIAKLAGDFWGRVNLLFGLLA